MRTPCGRTAHLELAAILLGLAAADASAAQDFSGVWGMVQHNRLGRAVLHSDQPERITLLSELANQSRRMYLDGRTLPDGLPDQRVGFSVGHWEGDTLVVATTNVTEWEAPRWPHSDAFRVTERWSSRMPATSRSRDSGPTGRPKSKVRCSSTR